MGVRKVDGLRVTEKLVNKKKFFFQIHALCEQNSTWPRIIFFVIFVEGKITLHFLIFFTISFLLNFLFTHCGPSYITTGSTFTFMREKK